MNNMVKILFVCHGNICRSVGAQYIFDEMIRENGLEDEIMCDSAATSREEIGNPVYPPARDGLRKHGITDVSGKRARQIRRDDYGKYDLIIGMEQRNVITMLRIFGGDPEDKVKLLLSYSDNPRDISDPWYTRNFERAYDDIVEGCEALLESLI